MSNVYVHINLKQKNGLFGSRNILWEKKTNQDSENDQNVFFSCLCLGGPTDAIRWLLTILAWLCLMPNQTEVTPALLIFNSLPGLEDMYFWISFPLYSMYVVAVVGYCELFNPLWGFPAQAHVLLLGHTFPIWSCHML